tara:strand:- start:22496 stop:22954 length:459 start_codon:yes stop_codon:yes gene_type:complete
MAIDYSKRKSYRRIVAKAKSYDSRGKNSLKSNRERMRNRRKVSKDFFKDPNLGAKQYRAMESSSNPEAEFMKMYIDKKASANTLLRTMENFVYDGDAREGAAGVKMMFGSIKTGKELEADLERELKKQRRITRKNTKNKNLRQFYAHSLIGP